MTAPTFRSVPRSAYPIAAAAVWFVVNVASTLAVYGRVGLLTIVAMLIVTMITALATWLISRRHAWPFWQLVLLAAPIYWVLRLLLFSRQLS